MSEHISQLLGDFRTDHPGIVEEWEQQRTDALKDGDPEVNWPEINTPDGLAWWLNTEIELAEDIASGSRDDPDSLKRERGIGAYCVAMLHDLERLKELMS